MTYELILYYYLNLEFIFQFLIPFVLLCHSLYAPSFLIDSVLFGEATLKRFNQHSIQN